MSFEGNHSYTFPQLKIQMLEELLLDKELSDREFRLSATLILFELRSFEEPASATDERLSNHLGGRSSDTMSRAVKGLEKSGHFEIKRGTRNRATEYVVSNSFRMAAIGRKAKPINLADENAQFAEKSSDITLRAEECATPQMCGDSPADVQGTTPQMCPPFIKEINNKKILDSKFLEDNEKKVSQPSGSHCSQTTAAKPFVAFPSFGCKSDNPFWKAQLHIAWPDWSPRSNNSCTRAMADRVRKLAREQDIPLDDRRLEKLFSNVVGRWKK